MTEVLLFHAGVCISPWQLPKTMASFLHFLSLLVYLERDHNIPNILSFSFGIKSIPTMQYILSSPYGYFYFQEFKKEERE